MKIKKLYESLNYPNRMVVEMMDGSYKSFNIIPARKITKKDLTDMPGYIAKGKKAIEAQPFMYQIYGLEK